VSELLLGCGNSRDKRIKHGDIQAEWKALTTLDIDPACKPDVVWDMNVLPYPFADGQFDEIHAYESLEHCGRQGDWQFFFAQFGELWRILKPGGLLCGTVPAWDSPWAWADPGHVRVLPKQSFYLLHRPLYDEEVGKTTLSDYRAYLKGSFTPLAFNEGEDRLGFVLRKDE
jgi:Cyclopropane fatty acid synthase and related methyltransferases